MHYLFILLSIALLNAVNFISSANAQEAPPPAWSYDDDNDGQEDWGAIKGYETCESGSNQSPVIIAYTKKSTLPKLDFKHDKISGLLMFTRKSFIFKVKESTILQYGETPYSLQSIELHSPSGHRVKDHFHPLEIHLIHKDMQGNNMIVAVFADLGAENPAIKTLLKQAALKNLRRFSLNNANTLISSADSYFAYDGSLPYPPCTENVKWRVLKEPITISEQQLGEITDYIGRNTRLPQPLYMREILETP